MTEFDPSLPRGLVSPLLTPFEDDLALAFDLFVDHAARMLSEGCTGLSPFGTTGEGPSLTREERINALWALKQGGIPPETMIPGTGLCSLGETADMSLAAMDLGCKAVLVLPPFFYRDVTEDGLHAYFARLIERIGEDARIVLYHFPKAAGVGLPVALVRKLRSDFPKQIVGIKDSSGDWDNTRALLQIEGLAVYGGSEETVCALRDLGGAGCISATANLNARRIAETLAAQDANDTQAQAALCDETSTVRGAIRRFGYIETPKALLALSLQDERWRNVRPPLCPASDTAARSLARAIAKPVSFQETNTPYR